jgi:hypothetical protein
MQAVSVVNPARLERVCFHQAGEFLMPRLCGLTCIESMGMDPAFVQEQRAETS